MVNVFQLIMKAQRLNYIVIRSISNEKLTSTMRAWQIYNYGGLKELHLTKSYRTPSISNPNEVIVKVKAASVNPIDLALIRGYGASTFNILRYCKSMNEFPKTLGRDFSGTVVSVGESVKLFKPGMDVIGALWPHEEGSHADFVVCNQSQLAFKPQKLSFTDAAALPYAGLTAYSALVNFGCLKAGSAYNKKILILGASGGVGTIAVQLAKAWGSYVAVTCREDSEDLMMELGADAIHSNELSNINLSYDIIFDCTGDDFETYSPYLKMGSTSRYITIKHSLLRMTDEYTPFIGFPLVGVEMTRRLIRSYCNGYRGLYHWAFFCASGNNLSIISNLVDRGLIIPVVHAQFAFDDTPEAYQCLQTGGVKGKIIIQMNEADT